MNRLKTCLFASLIGGIALSGDLTADTLTPSDLPTGDAISIQLLPSAAIGGNPGDTIGWGFSVTWTSSSDWMTFTSTNLAAETNPCLADDSPTCSSDPSPNYTDYIAAQGGPDDYSIAPIDSPWTESFGGVVDGFSQGVGAYQVTSDPTVAFLDAQDSGQIVFNFQVYDGDPFNGGNQIGESSYSYSTDVSVSVTPEPASYALFLAGFGILAAAAWRRRAAIGILSTLKH